MTTYRLLIEIEYALPNWPLVEEDISLVVSLIGLSDKKSFCLGPTVCYNGPVVKRMVPWQD